MNPVIGNLHQRVSGRPRSGIVEPAHYFVRVTKCEKRACRSCQQGSVAMAELEPRLVDTRASTGFSGPGERKTSCRSKRSKRSTQRLQKGHSPSKTRPNAGRNPILIFAG